MRGINTILVAPLALLALFSGCEGDEEAGRGWGAPVRLGVGNSPKIGMDAQGNGVVVWSGGNQQIFARRHTPGSGWSPELQIGQGIDSPRLAFEPGGAGLAVWRTAGFLPAVCWYRPGTGWAAPEALHGAGSSARFPPEVAVAPNGEAILVWSGVLIESTPQQDYQYSIWASRYTSGQGWARPESIGVGFVDSAPLVGMDAAGNAVAVWGAFSGEGGLWGCRYRRGLGWERMASLLPSGSNVGGLRLAVSPGGTAMAVWQSGAQIWSIRLEGNIWGSAAPVPGGATQGSYQNGPDISLDEQGNAVVAWIFEGKAWASRYRNGSGWNAGRRIDQNDTAQGGQAIRVSSAPGGATAAVWAQPIGNRPPSIWANRSSLTEDWGTAILLEVEETTGAFDPEVAVDAQGSVNVVWVTEAATSEIWANRYERSGSAVKNTSEGLRLRGEGALHGQAFGHCRLAGGDAGGARGGGGAERARRKARRSAQRGAAGE